MEDDEGVDRHRTGVSARCEGWTIASPMPGLIFYYDDPLSWAMLGALFVVLIVIWFVLILTYLPRELRVKDVVKASFGDDLDGKIQQLLALGFENLTLGWLTRTTPPVIIIPFLHRAEGMYCALFRSKRHPHRALPLFVTPLNRGSGALFTSYLPQLGSLVPPANFLQVLDYTGLDQLKNAHQRGLQYLERNGFELDSTSGSDADQFLALLRAAVRNRREAFLQAPFRNTVRLMGDLFTGRTRYEGELEAQPAAHAEIAALRNPLVRGTGRQAISLTERDA